MSVDAFTDHLQTKYPPFSGLRPRRFAPKRPRRPTSVDPMPRRAREIVAAVLAQSSVTLEELTSEDRTQRVVLIRDEAIYALRQALRQNGNPVWSAPQIGRFFGRDHSTILTSLKRQARRMS